jgi:hypothetical protein
MDEVTLCESCGGSDPNCPDPNTEWDGIACVYPVPDGEVEPIIETGPDGLIETVQFAGGGLVEIETPDVTFATYSVDDDTVLDWPEDVVGVVVRGQDDGLAHMVNRAFGGSEGPFDGVVYDRFLEMKRSLDELADYPDAVVGKCWALVLPKLELGSTGFAVRVLCKVAEVPVRSTLDVKTMYDVLVGLTGEEPTEELVQTHTVEFTDWLDLL